MNNSWYSGLVFLSCVTIQAAEIYQWKDAKGVWQFTEEPPVNIPFQVKQLPDTTTISLPEEKPVTNSPEKIEKLPPEKIEKPVVSPNARTEKLSPDLNNKKINEIKTIPEEPQTTVKKSLVKPQRQSRYVSDYAQLLLLEDRQTLQEILEQFERQQQIEIVIFTCYTLSDYEGGKAGIESFSERFFHELQLKQGILIVISLLDKQLFIYPSPQFHETQREKIKKVQQQILIPAFQEGRFSEGLLKAVQSILTIFKPQQKNDLAEIKETPKEIPKQVKKETYWLEIILILSLGLWWALLGWWRQQKHRCPQCSEKLLENKLNQGFIQKHCPSCGTQLILAPVQSRWRWRRCPSCGNQGFHVKSVGWHINQLELIKECRVCGFKRQEQLRLLSVQNFGGGAE